MSIAISGRRLLYLELVETIRNARNAVANSRRVRWVWLAIALLSLLVLSLGLAYLFQVLTTKFQLPLYQLAWLAYLIVFGTSLVANLTIIAPVPFAASIMIAAATKWNPVLVALFASIGGSLGELSGYYAGYLGKKIAIPENVFGYRRVEHWINKYGVWAILVLAFQPVIPFDIGGLVAGATKMPLRKCLPAIFAGKFAKYILVSYGGAGVFDFLP